MTFAVTVRVRLYVVGVFKRVDDGLRGMDIDFSSFVIFCHFFKIPSSDIRSRNQSKNCANRFKAATEKDVKHAPRFHHKPKHAHQENRGDYRDDESESSIEIF